MDWHTPTQAHQEVVGSTPHNHTGAQDFVLLDVRSPDLFEQAIYPVNNLT